MKEKSYKNRLLTKLVSDVCSMDKGFEKQF